MAKPFHMFAVENSDGNNIGHWFENQDDAIAFAKQYRAEQVAKGRDYHYRVMRRKTIFDTANPDAPQTRLVDNEGRVQIWAKLPS